MFGKMFAAFADMLKDAVASLESNLAKVKTQGTLNNVAGVAWLVAKADGDADADERQKFMDIVARACPAFSADDAKAAWNRAMGMNDAQIYREIAMANAEEAELLVRVGVGIGGADGDFDEDEKKIVRKIATDAFLNPKEFGL